MCLRFPGGASDPRVLNLDGRLGLALGDLDRAERQFRAVLDLKLSRALDDLPSVRARIGLGEVLLARGDVGAARDSLEEILALAEAHRGSPCGAAPASFALARALAAGEGPRDRARQLAEDAAADYAKCGHQFDGERRRIASWIAATREE